jgi:hypothetical protein
MENFANTQVLPAADPFALDPAIATMCDDAQVWMTMAAMSAMVMGLTLAQGIDAMLRDQTRIYTGYMSEEQRRAVRHRMYCDGVMTPPVGQRSGRSWVRPAGPNRKAAA